MSDGHWMLPHQVSSPHEARAAVRQFLSDTDEGPADRDVVVLVVSELVSNAVLHSGDQCRIELLAHAAAGTLHIEVLDEDPAPPERKDRSALQPYGRGLSIVDEMTAAWGWEPLPGDGKRVWCDLRPGGPYEPVSPH